MLSMPALAAPYATVPGVGLRPLTLAMLTIEPPWRLLLHHGVRVRRNRQRPKEVELDDLAC